MAQLAGDHDARCRATRLGVMLARGERITSALIRSTFKVSKATAKRDMTMLATSLPVQSETTERNQRALFLPIRTITHD